MLPVERGATGGAAAVVLPVVVVSAGSITYTTAPVSPRAIDGVAAATTVRTPQHVSFYSLGRASIFAVFREGDDLFGQLSGQWKLRLAAAGDGSYSYPVAAGRITLAVNSDRDPAELRCVQTGPDMLPARYPELPAQPSTH